MTLHAGKHLILHMRARLRPRQHPRHSSWVSGRSEISLSQPPHNRALEGRTRRSAVLIPSVIWVFVTSTFARSRAPAPCILFSLLILLHDLHIGAMKHPHLLIHTCPPTSARCRQSLNEQSPRRRPVASSACRSQEEPPATASELPSIFHASTGTLKRRTPILRNDLTPCIDSKLCFYILSLIRGK